VSVGEIRGRRSSANTGYRQRSTGKPIDEILPSTTAMAVVRVLERFAVADLAQTLAVASILRESPPIEILGSKTARAVV
jgi:hypothetical protein